MPNDIPPYLVRTLLGFGLGVMLGFVARRGRFCTLGAIEDAIYSNDMRRIRAWLLATAVAIVGVHALEFWGGLDLTRSIYAGPRNEWGGAIAGGLLFGVGMALVGTCGFGTLLRQGGGDLKALVTFLVMAFTAMIAMRGFARLRLTEPLTFELSNSGSQRLLIGLTGLSASAISMAPGMTIAVAVIAATLIVARKDVFKSIRVLATGLAVGLIVNQGWWASAIAGFDPFDARRVESFSFVAPLGDTLLYTMLTSALRPDFPVGAVGVVAGAFLAAQSSGQLEWEAPDDAGERHLFGAFLMGTGGIAALGCTIGQGVTGLSTLLAR